MVKILRPVCLAVILALVLSLGAGLAPAVMPDSGVASASNGEVLYAADGAGGNPNCNLYILNPANGAVLGTIGPIGYAVTRLAFAPDGTLYGSTGRNPEGDAPSPCSLITINPATGAGTLIGDFQQDGQTAADISFGPDGTLYGWLEPESDDLVTINTGTGQATIVGPSVLDTWGSGLAFSPGGTLYFTGDGEDGWLRTINPATGAPTIVASMIGGEGGKIGALAFNASGVLYGVSKFGEGGQGPSMLITINTATGQITWVGETPDALDAIVFGTLPPVGGELYPVNKLGILIPWMGLAALFIGGLTWFALRRRRAYS